MNKTLFSIVIATLCIAFSATTSAADARFADGIRQGEAQQAQIKVLVQRANADLTAIINELNRNGIGGEDVKILGRIRDVLGDLTAKDMATVIALLQEARNAADPSKFRGDATDAVVKQQAIVVKMRQLLLEYKRQQDLYELSLRFTELAQRQHGNMKEAIWLVRALKNSSQLDELQRSNKTQQGSEQEAIRDETRGLIAKLGTLASEADKDTAERLRKSLEQAEKGRLEPSLQSAVEQLKDVKLYLATSAERSARDRLYDLAALVAPVEDTATKLRKAAEKLDKAIAEQKMVIGFTSILAPQVPANDDSYLKVEDRQADNVDLVDRLHKDLEVIAPTVGDVLKLGQNQMQFAREHLKKIAREPAITMETQALVKLEEARKLLDTQIEKADAEKPKGDTLERAKELKEKISQLRKDQEKINEETKTATPAKAAELAKAEAKLQQTAKDIQIETAPESLPAAEEVSAAARDMDHAQEKLAKAAVPDAQPPEQSAVDHLVKAEKALDQQIAKLEHDKEQLAKLEESRDKVAKLIQEEQHVALDTAKEAGEEKAKKDAPNEDARKEQADKAIAEKQDAVEKKTEEAKATLPEEGKEAAAPLDQSQKDMKKAEKALENKQTPDAQPHEQQAINNLNKAKDALDKKIAELQKELGQQPDNANKLDDLAKALEKAQDDLNKTQDQMAHDPVKDLAKEQKAIADELQKKQDKDPASQPLAQAKEAAKNAAEDLEKNDLPKAIKEMKKAEDAIAKSDQAKPEDATKELGKEQSAVKKAAEQLAENPPAPADQQLGKVANDVTDAAANDKGALPDPAKGALKKAQAALNDAAKSAKAGDKADAGEKTTTAQDAITDAQAAIALAKEGMQPGQMADGKDGKGPPSPKPGPPGQDPGKGQGKGKGEGEPNGPPPPGPTDENAQSKAKGDRKDTRANARNDGSGRGAVNGVSNFVNLPARERQAVQQGQKDKYPEEYGPAIEQYLKNLSDQENK